MSAQETAEAILLVIKRLAKWSAAAILLLVAVGLVVGGGIWAYHYFDYDRPKSQIKIVVFRSEKLCSKDYPYMVGLVNNSSRTIVSYSFRFKAHKKGRSSNLAAYSENTDDKVIKPGDSWGTCWRIKSEDSTYNEVKWITDPNLEVEIEDFRPMFQ